ncbi:MAG: FHA domain-containing protein [Phycisphaeraceae bacterium]|nr:MAG: FHA domain-containing protein [Phycisphaeraceae bacterium]
MATLTLICENNKSTTVELKERPVAIGRHPDNDIVIKDDLASRFHCVIEPSGSGRYSLRDLGSRNGVKVNEQKVQKWMLRPGDSIQVGSHVFRVEAEGGSRRRERKAPVAKEGDQKWALELVQMIESLPPKEQLENITLIDAKGEVSEALAGQGPGAMAVRLLLQCASKARATDLHFEPKPESVHVRLRVDGVMVTIVNLPSQVGEWAMGLIKAACQMKSAGREAVLDGHFSSRIEDRRVDYRASFTPSVHGQKLVVRVLDLRDTPKSLNDLGLAPYMLESVRRVCEQSAGMILVVGPTGSGKTTTLYNCMRTIDSDRRNVVTIEDPVEYHLSGITQIPADHDKGNTFGALLRSVLRQDPDVILVGEVRDDETARVAMQAAMTGHLVFSTLHARDTIGGVFRLLDLGVEPYLVSNSITLILAQRLVRVLCDDCKRPVNVTPKQATKMGRYLDGQKQVYTATGCAKCLRTGYRGRKAVCELLEFNEELRDVILNKPSIQAIRKIAEGGLFTTLIQSGWQHVARGETSIEEIDQAIGGL